MRHRLLAIGVAALLAVTASLSGAAGADTTVRVDENGDAGWVVNPDPNNATAFAFTLDAASIGTGSLAAGPIGANPAEKLIAALGLGVPVADLASISYDFRIAGTGTAADANEFYLNVYANIDDSDNFYDCRFDYVPTTGSTSGFTTASYAVGDAATSVAKRGTRIPACPATLAGMPEGSHVRAIVLNVGDTTAGDAGLAGYLDNVVVATSSGATTYDFEAHPPTKDACKRGGFALYGYPNQGACVSAVASPVR